MKKGILILMLLCFAFSTKAHDYELYRCYSYGLRHFVNNKWTEWVYNNCDFIIRLDADGKKLEINNNANTIFYFDSELSSHSSTDLEGDSYVAIKWLGYDQDGKRCNLLSVDWRNLLNRNFKLFYSDIEALYKCDFLPKPVKDTKL